MLLLPQDTQLVLHIPCFLTSQSLGKLLCLPLKPFHTTSPTETPSVLQSLLRCALHPQCLPFLYPMCPNIKFTGLAFNQLINMGLSPYGTTNLKHRLYFFGIHDAQLTCTEQNTSHIRFLT